MQVFLHLLMCMFLKRERPEMDDLERKKKFGCEGKILSIFKKKSYARYPSKNIFAYSTISEHSKHFFLYFEGKKNSCLINK